MSRWRIDPLRRPVRWLTFGAFFAVAPKCLLCVAAYAGFGAVLGFGGRELCGASDAGPVQWAPTLAMLGPGLGLVGLLAHGRRRPLRSVVDRRPGFESSAVRAEG